MNPMVDFEYSNSATFASVCSRARFVVTLVSAGALGCSFDRLWAMPLTSQQNMPQDERSHGTKGCMRQKKLGVWEHLYEAEVK